MIEQNRIEKAIENYIYQSNLLKILWKNRQLIDMEEYMYFNSVDNGKRSGLAHGDISIKSNSISNRYGINTIAIIELVLKIDETQVNRANDNGLNERDIINILRINKELNNFSAKLEEFILRGKEVAYTFKFNNLNENEEFQCFSCCADKRSIIKKNDLDLFEAIRGMKSDLLNNDWRAGAELMLVSKEDKRAYLIALRDFEDWKSIKDPNIYCLVKYWRNNKQEKIYPFTLIIYPLKMWPDSELGFFHVLWFGALKIENKNAVRCVSLEKKS